MPHGVMELLACWRNGLGRSPNVKIWSAIPHCLFEYIWGEKNDKCFNGKERNLLGIKRMLIRSPMDWLTTTELISHSFVIL